MHTRNVQTVAIVEEIEGPWTYHGVSIDGQRPRLWYLTRETAERMAHAIFKAAVIRGELGDTDHKRHGGAADRGSADRYYGRPFEPHYYVGATRASERVAITDTTSPEYQAYKQAYDSETDRKDWG